MRPYLLAIAVALAISSLLAPANGAYGGSSRNN